MHEILAASGYKVRPEPESLKVAGAHGADFGLELERRGKRFPLVLQMRASGSLSEIYEAIGRFAVARHRGAGELCWVFVAPYVSPKGRELCRAGGISFIDDLWNCDLQVGDTHLQTDTARKPPRVRRAQHALFAKKSSRVSLALLLEPNRSWTQRGLAAEVGVSVGLVSRILRALVEEGYAEGGPAGWRVPDRERLLAAWAEEHGRRRPEGRGYFSRSDLLELEGKLEEGAAEGKYRYALTAESGAKYRAPFANVTRLVSYADRPAAVVEHLALRSVETGANVVIFEPRDEGVFYKMRREPTGDGPGAGGRFVTNDIYLYLDLVTNPARGREQAEHLMSVIAQKERKRARTTEEESRFHEFLEARDLALSPLQPPDWEKVIEILDSAFVKVAGLEGEDVERETLTCRRVLWLALLETVKAKWSGNAEERDKLVERISREMPPDESLLEQYPPSRTSTAHVRYMLGLRHAILAVRAEGEARDRHARMARDHFKIAVSRYTSGAGDVAKRVEGVWQWLREVAKIDLVL